MSTYMDTDPTINDRRRTKGVLRDAVVGGDVYVQRLICMSEENPHRARYMAYSAELSSGDVIPDHYGPIGEVVIKPYTGGSFEPAVEADTVEQINEWRENVNDIYGAIAHDAANSPLSGWFKQVGTRIRFTGYKAKVEIANMIVPAENEAAPTLYSPDAFEDVIYAHASSESYTEGDDMQELDRCRSYIQLVTPLILAGAYEVPPLQQK